MDEVVRQAGKFIQESPQTIELLCGTGLALIAGAGVYLADQLMWRTDRETKSLADGSRIAYQYRKLFGLYQAREIRGKKAFHLGFRRQRPHFGPSNIK